MKRLKFAEPLPAMVLGGEKTTTWRINDDKDVSIGDTLSLCDTDGREFAAALVHSVRMTRFGALSEDDWDGHETFSSADECYRTYSRNYGFTVTKDTPVKVIKFTLLNTL